jgi:hypothetical protein
MALAGVHLHGQRGLVRRLVSHAAVDPHCRPLRFRVKNIEMHAKIMTYSLISLSATGVLLFIWAQSRARKLSGLVKCSFPEKNTLIPNTAELT